MAASENRGESKEDLPWSKAPLLAERPAGLEFGYLKAEPKERPLLKGCRFEELEEKVESGEASLVAVPELDRLAPPSIVARLWPAVQARERRRRLKERQNAVFNVCLFGGIALYSIARGDPASPLILLLFVIFGLVPLLQYVIGALQRWRHGGETFEETRERTLFAFWLGAGDVPATRWCTRGLIGLFALQVLASAVAGTDFFGTVLQSLWLVGPASIEAAALVKPLVRDGEIWRLLTCGLLHGGLLHIGFNAVAFANVGAVLEAFYGRAVLLVTFFVSVIAGSLCSLVFLPEKTSVGASGGILGLVGFLLVVGLRHRGILPAGFAKSIVRSVLFMAALGVMARAFIDNAAHAGGFLAGCLVALPISRDARALGNYRPGTLVRGCGWVSLAALALAALWVVLRLLVSAGLGH